MFCILLNDFTNIFVFLFSLCLCMNLRIWKILIWQKFKASFALMVLNVRIYFYCRLFGMRVSA